MRCKYERESLNSGLDTIDSCGLDLGFSGLTNFVPLVGVLYEIEYFYVNMKLCFKADRAVIWAHFTLSFFGALFIRICPTLDS